ncbi:hypothetical protein EZS27_021420 [termite gut metagenome]|uniref:Uncharacterized protein n=1 Tax=termite gut metagenome TaxID=433724 RepID=A0A5J4RA14_9ZZZZ
MIYKYYNYSAFDSNRILEFSKILNIPITYWFNEIPSNSQSIVNGNKSAASIYGNANVVELVNKDKDKEIEHLKTLLEEKERTIQILMNK